ncbi:unnamed protein product, partial [Rotaria socialis]
MPRHAFLQSKTTLTTCKKNSNQSERIHDKENEKNDNDQMRKYLTNKRDNVVIFQQHGQRWSK